MAITTQITEMTTAIAADDKRLPVTLLSGFLGSGKTTLLSYILKSKDHGLRCAIIVNDMGALNIDAALISNHKLTQKEEKVVQMQNGCICCTLRADLFEEVAQLAETGQFDYLIIESTGISEPIQVAETFTQEFAETMTQDEIAEIEASLPNDSKATPESRKRLAQLIAQGGLSKVARLDTCVSVVDCTTFLSDFDTTDFLSDRHGVDAVDPEDERNVTDLLTDQIEFADVILLNKTDVVSESQVQQVEKLARMLNPSCNIIRTVYSRVELSKILNTHTFDFEKAAMGAGWLQSLRESNMMELTGADGVTKMVPKPETLEYGIGSFVYRARKPFHPHRLWDLVSEPFAVIQTTYEDDGEEEDGSNESSTGSMDVVDMVDQGEHDAAAKLAKIQAMKAEKEELNLPERAKFKRESPVWKGLMRSKGFIWLATRNQVHGEWSQAGVMFTLSGGSNWMCTTSEDEWPFADQPEAREEIRKDFEGTWGDRRQEIVLIGQNLDQELLTQTLDAALLDDKEWGLWQKIMKSKKSEEKKALKLYDVFDDGWEDWLDDIDDAGEEKDESKANAPVPSESIDDKERVHSTKLESTKLAHESASKIKPTKIEVHHSMAASQTQGNQSKVKEQKPYASQHRGNHESGHVHPPPGKKRKTAKA